MRQPIRSLPTVALGVALALALIFGDSKTAESVSVEIQNAVPDGENAPPPTDQEVRALGEIVARLLAGEVIESPIPAVLGTRNVAVHVVLRAKGVRLADAWAAAATGLNSLWLAVLQAKAGLDSQKKVETVEVALASGFRTIAFEHRDRYLSNVHRGVRGMELQYQGRIYRYGPTQMIAGNVSFKYLIKEFKRRHGLDEAEMAKEVVLRYFGVDQFLVRLAPRAGIERSFRGNRLVPLSAVRRETVKALARRTSDWMIRNVAANGRMTYKYWPSRRRASTSNNMIRQWMASVCLGRIARERNDAALNELVEKNVRYNLDRFFRVENGRGFIQYEDKAKLGAAALAALAIVEHPNRPAFAAEEMALRRTVVYLWQDDGSFRTFYKPKERNDVQNFYPGEALLLWAFLYQESGDAELLRRFMKSVGYYREWHLRNRNPAFVPWHTQAYYMVWRKTQDPILREWIFEMNDWLLGMQRHSRVVYPDTEGRFYDPRRPFGPPHASSTGVYLEGLIDAYRLAKAVGDRSRTDSYRRAIVHGLRSAMQLEFADDLDMFYVPEGDRNRVRGGLRTTVYNNEIRVDNVQHVLMALQKILPEFVDEDYR